MSFTFTRLFRLDVLRYHGFYFKSSDVGCISWVQNLCYAVAGNAFLHTINIISNAPAEAVWFSSENHNSFSRCGFQPYWCPSPSCQRWCLSSKFYGYCVGVMDINRSLFAWPHFQKWRTACLYLRYKYHKATHLSFKLPRHTPICSLSCRCWFCEAWSANRIAVIIGYRSRFRHHLACVPAPILHQQTPQYSTHPLIYCR